MLQKHDRRWEHRSINVLWRYRADPLNHKSKILRSIYISILDIPIFSNASMALFPPFRWTSTPQLCTQKTFADLFFRALCGAMNWLSQSCKKMAIASFMSLRSWWSKKETHQVRTHPKLCCSCFWRETKFINMKDVQIYWHHLCQFNSEWMDTDQILI